MFAFLSKTKNLILDALFPPICLNCRGYLEKDEKLACRKCLSSIKTNNTLFCPVCRSRLADNKKICHFDFPYLLAAAGDYNDEILRNLIHCFKYRSFENLAPVLGEIILAYLDKIPFNGENLPDWLVIPVPLHSCRERQRGFNQAKLLAETVAKKFGLELIDALKKIKNSEPQAKIKDMGLRAKNMENCFGMKNPASVAGKNIILVDDVFTSGATAGEAVKILKKNNAKKIIVLVLAKA
jgi:competence protein ComFC